MAKQLNVDMRFTADTSQAKASIQDLQRLLSEALSQATIGAGGTGISAEINKAKIAAAELKVKLQDAMRTDGSLDLVKFNNSLQASGKTLSQYGTALAQLGPSGKQAFLELTQSISSANIQFQASNSLVNQLWVTLKNVARFQITSSALHTLIGGIQSAYGYAQDLNESLNNIRIVTGQNIEQVAKFAQTANKSARELSATTLDYTNASLIYYQQGLDDAAVAERTATTLKLANVSRQSAETVSEQMTAIWNNFDDGSHSLEYYADVITALGAKTASSSAEIAQGLSKFAAVANTVGLSYENATAALATIVATTRQSADSVGTGLRTLFSRLQGLKLGETLEDGVDLNKYSAALKTVGVDALDATGELRSMDNILEDLGKKWQTLSDTQQVALAQTVGGVRQYTTLIALMDNWDFFKQNQGIAGGAEGTLQGQADIYAESWEASRDRVKAAAEAIHKALIDEDFFIGLNNRLEKGLDGIANLIKALGGLPGVLATVSTAFLTAFGPQLSQGIDNLIQRIQFMSGKTQDNIVQMKIDANNQLASMYAGTKGTSNSIADIAYKSQAEASNAILQQQLSTKQALSAEEAKIASLLQQQHNLLVQNAVESGKELEQAQKKFDLSAARTKALGNNQNTKDFQQDFWVKNALSRFQSGANLAGTDKGISFDTNTITILKEQLNDMENEARRAGVSLQESLGNTGYSEPAIQALLNLRTALKGTNPDIETVREKMLALANVNSSSFNPDQLNNYIQQLKTLSTESANLQTATNAFSRFDNANGLKPEDLQALQTAIEGVKQAAGSTKPELEKAFGDSTVAEKLLNLENVLKNFPGDTAQATQAMQEFQQALNNAKNGKNSTAIFENIRTELRKIIPDEKQVEQIIKDLENEFNNLSGAEANAAQSTANLGTSFAQLKTFLASVKGEIQTIGQGLTGLATGLSGLAGVVNGLKGLKDIWKDEDSSFGDKMLSSASSISMIIFSATRMIDGFSKVPQLFGSLFTVISSGAITAADSLMGYNAAQIAAGLGTTSFGEALLVLGPIIAGVAAVIGVLVYGIYELYRAYNADAIAAKNAAEAAESLNKKSQMTAQTAQQIKSAFSNYDTAVNALHSCTKGTEEWNTALEKVNNEILSILENNPELAQQMKLTRDENGMLSIENRDETISQVEEKASAAQAAAVLGKTVASEKALEADQTRVRREFTLSATTTTTDEETRIIGQQNTARYSAINNAKETNQWTPEQWEQFSKEAGMAGEELANFKTVISQLANSTDQIASQIKNTSQIIAESKLGDKFSDSVKGMVSGELKPVYDKIYNDILTESDKYSKSQRQADLDRDDSIWGRYLDAIGEDFNTTLYKLADNAIQGEDDNRTYHFIDAEGKAQSIRAEEMAAAIAAAEALSQLTDNANEASIALGKLRSGDNKEIASAIEGYFANGNFATATQSQIKNIKAGISSKNGDIKAYLTDLLGEDVVSKMSQADFNTFKARIENSGIKNVRANAFGEDYEKARDRFNIASANRKFGLEEEYNEASAAFNKLTTPITQAFEKISSLSGFNDLSDTDYNGLITSFKTIYSEQGSAGLSKFINSLSQLNLSSEDAATIATTLASTNWSSAESIAHLQEVIAQIAGPSNAASNALLQLIESIKQAAGEATTVEQAQERHQFVSGIQGKVKNYGDTVSSDEYTALKALMDTHGGNIDKWFSKNANGEYVLTNFDVEGFQNYMSSLGVSGFAEKYSQNAKAASVIEDIGTETYYEPGEEDSGIAHHARSLEDLQTKTGGAIVDDQLKLLELLDGVDESKLKAWQEANEKGDLNSEDYAAIADEVKRTTQGYEDLNDLREHFIEQNEEMSDTMDFEEMKQLMDEYNISSEDVLRTKEQLIDAWGDEAKAAREQYEENQKILASGGSLTEEQKKQGALWEDLEEQAEKLALQQLIINKVTEDAVKNFAAQDKALKNMTKSQRLYSKEEDQMEKVLRSVLKTNKQLTKEFVDAAYKSGKYQKAINGDSKAVRELNQDLFKTLTEGLTGMEDYQDGLRELSDETLKQVGVTSDAMSQLWSELSGTEAGDALSAEATSTVNSIMQSMVQSIYAQTGNITTACDAAYAAMRGEGIEPPELESVEFEGEGSTIPSYIEHGVHAEPNKDVVPPSVLVTPTDVEIPETVIPGKKVPILQFKDAPATASGGAKKSAGGGGNGGGGGKPKTPKAHKKSDISKRYHRVNEQIADRSREQTEAERRKDRAFGQEKLDQLEKEIKLRKEQLKLQQDYIDQINGFLKGDRQALVAALDDLAVDDFKIDIEFDAEGVIVNYQEIEDTLLGLENWLIDVQNDFEQKGLDIPMWVELYQRKIDDAREYMDRYEETLNLLEEQINETSSQVDELSDALFEIITTKVELEIGINDDEAARLEYFLTKYEDNAYKAAEAIAIFGDQAENTLKRISIYQEGINDLLASKGLSLEDLSNLDDATVRKLIEEGDFTQEQIDSLREWRDGLLEANQTMMELRTNIAKRVLDTFDQLNEKVENSYDLFDHYNSVLETYKDITDVLGQQINKEQRQLIDNLNNAMLDNQKNAVIAAKARYDDLVEERARAQELYNTALAEGSEDAAQKYEEMLSNIDEALRDAEETYLDSWQESIDQAQTIFETMIENIVKDFEDAMSGTFGSMDYLQEAFDRQSEVDEQYLQDYDKLYELNKLQRDLNKVLNDTRGVTNRKELLELQEQINDYQERGVRLSQYDVDVLRKKFELQQAYNNLQLTEEAKSTVRLSRDDEGNWGYVYTADEDQVAEAEQEYEDKLHEYQKLNDDYIKELQEKALEAQTTYRDMLQEIMSDMTLTDEERARRIQEINEWLAAQQSFFDEQSQHVFENQAGTLERMLDTYHQASADLIDTWEETNLSNLLDIDNLDDYMELWIDTSANYLTELENALRDRQSTIDELLHITGTSIDTFGDQVDTVITSVGDASKTATDQVTHFIELLNTEFGAAIDGAIDWEQEYAKQMQAAIDANEDMVESVNDLIEALAQIPSYNKMHKKLEDFQDISKAYAAGELKDEEFFQQALQFGESLNDFIKLDTGGYTGSWGPEGKLAVLHEKENVFNAQDTQNLLDAATLLRQIDISTAYMASGFGDLQNPVVSETGTVFEQTITIEEVSFPDATDRNEIEAAFDNLANKAIQYANRKDEE